MSPGFNNKEVINTHVDSNFSGLMGKDMRPQVHEYCKKHWENRKETQVQVTNFISKCKFILCLIMFFF